MFICYGVGLCDDSRPRKELEKDKIYTRWQGMVMRCYSDVFQESRPTYKGSTVCHSWLTFSNFRDWCKEQRHEGLHMDKDLLLKGNKEYAPDKVCFIPPELNSFFTDRNRYTSSAIGVRITPSGRYSSRIMNPFTGCREVLGSFADIASASSAWRNRKCELANIWADILQDDGFDDRIVAALRVRYKEDL